jgi:hypothetical protein
MVPIENHFAILHDFDHQLDARQLIAFCFDRIAQVLSF